MKEQRSRWTDWQIKLMFLLQIPRRFTLDECRELYRISIKQSQMLMKRKTFIIGLILTICVVVYHTHKGFSPFNWKYLLTVVSIVLGPTLCAGAIREHYVELLLRLKQHPERIADI